MNPYISVIIPVYNAELYIENCIESVLNQTFKNFEVIIIDDGSKDKTYKICNELSKKDSRIKVFQKRNEGVSAARNYGISRCKGEYIIFIDSDDWIEDNEFEVIYQYNQKYNTDIILFNSINDYFKNNKLVKSSIRGTNKLISIDINNMKDYFTYLFKSTEIAACWNKCFKSNIIKNNKIMFNENMVMYEDFEFVLRYFNFSNNILVIPDILYHYNIKSEVFSLSKRDKLNIAEDMHYLFKSLNKFLQRINLGKSEMIEMYEYISGLYNLCFSKMLEKKYNMNQRKETLKFIKSEKYFIDMVNNYGKNMRFYKILMPLLNNRLYRLSYYFIKFRLG